MTASTSTYGIISTDENIVVKTWNDWVANASGISSSQAVGRKIQELVPGIESRGLIGRFQKVLDEGTVEILSSVFHKYLIPCEIGSNDGQPALMKQHVTVGPIKSDKGIVGLIITIEDASEHHQLNAGELEPDQKINLMGDSDWRIRKAAQLSLTENANHSTLASLLKKMKEEHNDVAALNSILLVLSQSVTDVVGALLSLLEEDDIDLRIYVIQALGDRNDPKSIPTLIQCLNDPDANVQYHTIEALGKLEAHEATDRLCEIATSGDFFTAFPAIDALARLNDSNVIPKLISLIDDPVFSESLMALLGKLGDVSMAELLTGKLNEPEAFVNPVASALAEINARYEIMYGEGDMIKDVANNHINEQGIRNLIAAIENSEPEAIRDIIKVLGWIRSPEAQKALTQMLGNPALQKEVIESFVNFGNKVTDLLIGQLIDSDGPTRIAAAIALGRIGDPRSAPELIRMIGESDDLTVFVIGSLAKLGVSEAFEPLLVQLGAENPSVRRAAIAALNSVGHPEMRYRMEQLIQSENPLLRESAIHIAGYFGYRNCRELVKHCLEDTDIRVVCAAIENLPFFDDPVTNNLLADLYSNGSSRIRTSVVKAANHIDEVEKFSTLADSLGDSDAWVRFYAIRSICNHLLNGYLPQLVEIAQTDKAIHVRLAAIEAIGQMNGTAAIPVFTKLLSDDNTDIVLTTIYALGMMQSEKALILLMQLIDNPDQQKRTAVIKAISHFNTPEVIEKLYLISATEIDSSLTDAAIEGLSTIKSELAIESLLKLTSVVKIKEKCISQMVQQKKFAVPYLIEVFPRKAVQLQRNIIEILSRTKLGEASAMLMKLLDHSNSQIRVDSMNALFRIGYLNFREKVEKMALSDVDLFVRYTAKEILKKI
jgi:PAS domain S-box-containing protein